MWVPKKKIPVRQQPYFKRLLLLNRVKQTRMVDGNNMIWEIEGQEMKIARVEHEEKMKNGPLKQLQELIGAFHQATKPHILGVEMKLFIQWLQVAKGKMCYNCRYKWYDQITKGTAPTDRCQCNDCLLQGLILGRQRHSFLSPTKSNHTPIIGLHTLMNEFVDRA